MQFKTITNGTAEPGWISIYRYLALAVFLALMLLGIAGGVVFALLMFWARLQPDNQAEFRRNCHAANGIPVAENVCVKRDSLIEVKP